MSPDSPEGDLDISFHSALSTWIMYKEILELTKKMAEIPSVTGSNAEALLVLNLVSEYLGGRVTVRTFERNGIVSRLWGDPEAIMNPRLLLSGHIDVVEAPTELFSPRFEDGKMYGRGVGDMKGHVASMAVGYRRWLEANGPRRVGLLLTSDEETGGFDGTRHVLEQGLKPTVVFIPDGSFNFDIVRSQKAPHHFHVRATGPGGHASRAFQTDNPINRIFAVYQGMRNKYSLATPDSPWHSTFEVTVVNTPGASANVIPSSVEAWFSWRWPLEEFTFKEGTFDMERFCKKYGCEVLPDGHGMGEGCYTDPNAEFVQTWKGVIENTLGRAVGFTNMHSATDGRHFFKHGAHVLVTSARTDRHHSIDEWVDVPSLVNLSRAIHNYLALTQ